MISHFLAHAFTANENGRSKGRPVKRLVRKQRKTFKTIKVEWRRVFHAIHNKFPLFLEHFPAFSRALSCFFSSNFLLLHEQMLTPVIYISIQYFMLHSITYIPFTITFHVNNPGNKSPLVTNNGNLIYNYEVVT